MNAVQKLCLEEARSKLGEVSGKIVEGAAQADGLLEMESWADLLAMAKAKLQSVSHMIDSFLITGGE